jgi:hypothetical protein
MPIVNKKFLIALIVLIAALSLFLIFGDKLPVRKKAGTEPVPDKQVEYLPHDQLPPNLPANLPLEADAPLQRTEIVRIKDKENQFVRRYYSQKTVAENYAIYEKYLTDNNWKIESKINQENLAAFSATHPNQPGSLLITISKNSITQDVTVEINAVIWR